MSRSKAVLFGINYLGTESELRGCANDVNNMAYFLRTRAKFDDIKVYTEETTPNDVTGRAILTHLRKLAIDSREGLYDRVWIHYSGHGASVRDWNGDERDGKDECILPVDFTSNGVITDDMIKGILRMFHKDTKVTLIFDCCHSGTICDLKYKYRGYDRRMVIESFAPECEADVCMISGCMDSQTSADAYNVRGMRTFTGAMTSCLLDVLKHETKLLRVIEQLNQKLKAKRFEQIAQLSASSEPNYNTELF
jgi:hypothetical protein